MKIKFTGDNEKSSIACYRGSIVVIFSQVNGLLFKYFKEFIWNNDFKYDIFTQNENKLLFKFGDDNEKQYIVFKI